MLSPSQPLPGTALCPLTHFSPFTTLDPLHISAPTNPHNPQPFTTLTQPLPTLSTSPPFPPCDLLTSGDAVWRATQASLSSLRSSLASIQWAQCTVRQSLQGRSSFDKSCDPSDEIPRELEEQLIRAEVQYSDSAVQAQHSHSPCCRVAAWHEWFARQCRWFSRTCVIHLSPFYQHVLRIVGRVCLTPL
eukprot:1170968-Prorocentrum_minimum.AAC.2